MVTPIVRIYFSFADGISTFIDYGMTPLLLSMSALTTFAGGLPYDTHTLTFTEPSPSTVLTFPAGDW
jgi:hypothetical protein